MNKLFIGLIVFTMLFAGAAAAQDALDIVTSSVTLSGNTQQTITGTFVVQNTGTTTIGVSFTGLTLTAGSRTLVISPITAITSLAPNAQQTVSMSVATGNSFADAYTGSLITRVTSDTTVNDSLPVSVTVNPAPALTATNPSLTAAKGTTKTATLTLTNTGNTDLSGVTLTVGSIASGTNTLPASAISLSSSTTSIAFGGSDTITVTVTPPATQASGTYTGPITINLGTSQVTATLTVVVRDAIHSVAFNSSQILLGSSTTDRNTTQSTTFVIENVGDFTESVTLSLVNVASSYNAQLSTTQVTLAPAATASVTLTASIPVSQDSGVQTVGKVQLSYSSTTTVKDVQVEARSRLSIEDIDVTVGQSTDNNLEEGERIEDDANPEDTVEFDIEVKNLFSDSQDIEIENIEVEVTIENIDDDDDLEESSDEIDLDADNNERVSVSFTVPIEADSGTYDVVIVATGDDENGARHTDTMNLKLRVDKEDDDVRVTRKELTSSTVSCSRTTSLRVEIRNFGADDQNDAALLVSNDALSLSKRFDDIELESDPNDRDSRFSQTVDIAVPASAAAGTYPIEIIAFIDGDRRIDREEVSLRVDDCAAASTSQGTATSTAPATTPDRVLVNRTATVTPAVSPAAAETVEVPFTQSPVFLALLVLGNLVVLGAIVFLVLKFLV